MESDVSECLLYTRHHMYVYLHYIFKLLLQPFEESWTW